MNSFNLHNIFCASFFILTSNIYFTHQHAYLSEPPSRASAWLVDNDFVDCCQNYNYNQMFCGGFAKQWGENGGKCGICGDSWDEPKDYEKGGSKYLGKIVRNYMPGTNIPVVVQITANHEGFFEFRLCNIDGWVDDASQECLNKTLLNVVGTQSPKYQVSKFMHSAEYQITIPPNFVCNHCVLQWKYVTGNSWGWDDVRNVSCVGCGPVQEHFVGCADISIRDPNQPELPTTTSTKTTTTLNITSTPEQKPSTSSSVPSTSSSLPSTSSSLPITTTSSVSPLTNLITSRTSSNFNEYNGCRSKLIFGTMIDLSREIAIYCSRMCDLRCETIISGMQEDNNDNYKSDPNYIACTQTCPQLCLCN